MRVIIIESIKIIAIVPCFMLPIYSLTNDVDGWSHHAVQRRLLKGRKNTHSKIGDGSGITCRLKQHKHNVFTNYLFGHETSRTVTKLHEKGDETDVLFSR